VRLVADAHVDRAALARLAGLLRHVDRFASSNASLLSVPRLSRDQNQGEVHDTADEADAGAPPRSAADRPVRRRTAEGDRRHAGVVRAAAGAAAIWVSPSRVRHARNEVVIPDL
jgi:hypothetical protein